MQLNPSRIYLKSRQERHVFANIEIVVRNESLRISKNPSRIEKNSGLYSYWSLTMQSKSCMHKGQLGGIKASIDIERNQSKRMEIYWYIKESLNIPRHSYESIEMSSISHSLSQFQMIPTELVVSRRILQIPTSCSNRWLSATLRIPENP